MERGTNTPHLKSPADAPLKALTSLFETLSSYFPITWLVVENGGKHTFSWNCCRDLFLFIRNGFRNGQHVEIFLDMMNMHGKKSRQVSNVVCFIESKQYVCYMMFSTWLMIYFYFVCSYSMSWPLYGPCTVFGSFSGTLGIIGSSLWATIWCWKAQGFSPPRATKLASLEMTYVKLCHRHWWLVVTYNERWKELDDDDDDDDGDFQSFASWWHDPGPIETHRDPYIPNNHYATDTVPFDPLCSNTSYDDIRKMTQKIYSTAWDLACFICWCLDFPHQLAFHKFHAPPSHIPTVPQIPGLLFLQTPHGFGMGTQWGKSTMGPANHLNIYSPWKKGYHPWKDDVCFSKHHFSGPTLKVWGGSRFIISFPISSLQSYPSYSGRSYPSFWMQVSWLHLDWFVGFCLTRPWDALWWSMMHSLWDEDCCIYCQRQAYFRFLGMMNWIRERVQSPFILSGRTMLSHDVFLRRLHLRLCEASLFCFTRQRYWSRCGCDGRAGHEHPGFLPRVPSAREWTKIIKNRAEGNHKSLSFLCSFSQRVWHVRADHIMIESQFPFLSGVDGVFFYNIYHIPMNWWGSSIWGTFIEHFDTCIVMFCALYLNLFDLLWPLLFNHHFNYIQLLCDS